MNKTLFISVAMLAAVSTTQAQVVNRSSKGLLFAPKTLSSAGIGVPHVMDNDRESSTAAITIYDYDFNTVKTINAVKAESMSESRTEEAFATITGTENGVPVYNINTAVWAELEGGSVGGYTEYIAPEEFVYTDFDNGTTSGKLIVSQTLFNDDDKWEYLGYSYVQTGPSYGDPYLVNANYETGKATIRRTVSRSTKLDAVVIYSEDGQVLTSIPIAELSPYKVFHLSVEKIYKLNGKTYIDVYMSCSNPNGGFDIFEHAIYRYDKNTTSVSEVARTKSYAHPFVTVEGDNINVNVGEGNDGANAVLVDMGGKSVSSATVPAGSTSATLNANTVPAGIYNVAVVKGGNVTQAQKVVLK